MPVNPEHTAQEQYDHAQATIPKLLEAVTLPEGSKPLHLELSPGNDVAVSFLAPGDESAVLLLYITPDGEVLKNLPRLSDETLNEISRIILAELPVKTLAALYDPMEGA